jgi:hypothetical protein
MWDQSDRVKYFELNSIDPYKVLGVEKGKTNLKEAKKKYYKLAKQLHPDKNDKEDGALEFLLLKECYLYIKNEEEIIEVPGNRQSSVGGLKEDRLKDDLLFSEIRDTRTLYTTNFEDPKIRSKLFAVDDTPFDQLTSVLKEKETGPSSYTQCLDHSPKNLFKNRKKFNLKYFNEVFEATKELNKEVVKFDINNLKGAERSDNFGEISYYNDIIVESKKEHLDNLAPCKEIYSETSKFDFDERQLKKLVSHYRKEKKQKEPELDTITLLARKKSEQVPEVDTSVSFAQAAINFRESQLQSTRAKLRANKEYIKSKIDIYPENFRKAINE